MIQITQHQNRFESCDGNYDDRLIIRMKSLQDLSDSMQLLKQALEEFQASCQGVLMELDNPQNCQYYPVIQLSEKFIHDQQIRMHSSSNRREPSIIYTKDDLATKPAEFLDERIIEFSQNSKKPLGDSNLRKLRKIFVDIPRQELSRHIQRLIVAGKIIDQSNEVPDVPKFPK
ncbi:hypothetical protein TRFO_08239 [Tritrichomonas foetus]|uniref:Uncharacterized protein n=1 Tax=Tritrichomonas foetus TaxID=1144522 RepID=A0A1J4JLF4_9EUKA|nr:hypothetical protein TRFO_08239 [Tritrichomonas foetus]|eukprot:OHS99914.1 hypothetical protein TRFO_08239 [Tritrichomonas foetus]